VASVSRRIALVIATIGAIFASLAVPLTPASAARDVSTPVLLSPANDPSTHLGSDIVFTWDAVAGASQYQLQVSPNGEWTNNVVVLPNNGIVTEPTLEMPVSLPNATYYWHVRAQVGGVWGRYSAQWTFVKDWEATLTVLKQPTTADPTITWAPVEHASLYLVRYLPAGDFDSTPGEGFQEVDCWTANTSVTPYASDATPNPEPVAGPGAPSKCAGNSGILPLKYGVTYAWELIAYDDTTAAAVTADTTPNVEQDCEQFDQPLCDADTVIGPTAFLFEPARAGTPARSGTVTGLTTTWHTSALPGSTCTTTDTCPTTPTFSWNPVPGANFYEVNVYRDPDGTNLYRSFSTAWPELTPSADLFDAQAGQPYYWTVSAGTCSISAADPTCAASGATGDTCPTGSGTTKPTLGTDIKVTPSGPEGDQTMIGGSEGTVSLLSSGVNAPACVIPSDGFVDETSVAVGFGGLITFTYDAPVASEAVTFLVVNPDGATSNASAPLTIIGGAQIILYQTSQPVTFAKRSGPITPTSPANHAVLSATSPTFKWQDFMTTGGLDSYDARNYELQISQDHSFDTTILDDKNVDLTQYTNPTTLLADGSYYWRVGAIDETGDLLTWSTIRQLTVNAVSPTVSFLSADGTAVDQPLVIQVSTPLRNLNGQTLAVVPLGAPTANAIRGRLVEGASNTLYSFFPHVPLATGGSYQLRLTQSVLDTTGNPAVVSGGPIRVDQTALNTSAGWQYSRGWTRHSASSALSGSFVQAKGGRIATIQVAGSELVVYGCKAPNMGHLTINIAGQNFTASENQSFTRCGEELWHGAIPGGVRTLTLRVSNGIGNFDSVQLDPAPPTTTTTGTTGSGGTPVTAG
jgi:hypothetical protein